MSHERGQPLLGDNNDQHISDSPELPSGRLRIPNGAEQARNFTLHDIEGGQSESNRRGMGFDVSGNPRSHAPGSSQTSVDSQFKDTPAPVVVDVEAQASNGLKRRETKCSDICHGWINQINFEKWYEWTAYYIPILEWLPQYKCTILLSSPKLSRELYF